MQSYIGNSLAELCWLTFEQYTHKILQTCTCKNAHAYTHTHLNSPIYILARHARALTYTCCPIYCSIIVTIIYLDIDNSNYN